MKLPNGSRARIDRRKIKAYLLSDEHPAGKSKAFFFCSMGFDHDRPQVLEECLRDHAGEGEAVSEEMTLYGKKFVVEGILMAPRGGVPLRSVWIIETGQETPRLVTAYPV